MSLREVGIRPRVWLRPVLVVLLVTTGAGLIGGVGLIVLAAPVTAVVQRSVRRYAAATAERRSADSSPAGEAAPAPAVAG